VTGGKNRRKRSHEKQYQQKKREEALAWSRRKEQTTWTPMTTRWTERKEKKKAVLQSKGISHRRQGEVQYICGKRGPTITKGPHSGKDSKN